MPSLSIRLLLFGLAVVVLFLALLWPSASDPFSATSVEAFHFATYLTNRSVRSWEHGVWTQALLEVHNAELTVFASDPFPNGQVPPVPQDLLESVPGLASAAAYINTSGTLLSDGGGTRDLRGAFNSTRS